MLAKVRNRIRDERQVAKLTSKGEVTIPRRVREALGPKTGDRIAFDVHGGRVQVHLVHDDNPFRKFAGIFRVGDGWTREQVDGLVDDLRGHDEYDRRLLGR